MGFVPILMNKIRQTRRANMAFLLIHFALRCDQSGHVPNMKIMSRMKKKIDNLSIGLQQSTGQIVRVNYPTVTVNIDANWPFLFELLNHFRSCRKSEKTRRQLLHSPHDFFIFPTLPTHVFSFATQGCYYALQETSIITTVPYQNARMTSFDVQGLTTTTSPSRKKCELINVQTEHLHLLDHPPQTLMNECIELAQHILCRLVQN